MILIVANDSEPHTAGVQAVLDRMGHEAFVFDLARFPRNVSLEMAYEPGAQPSFQLTLSEGPTIDLGRCRVAWWRRPGLFELGNDLTVDGHREFAYQECHEAVAGLWHALDATWVNPPHLDELAARKSFQLAVAEQCGFRVPPTLITNSPAAARRFVQRLGARRTIYKTFRASEEHWRETRVLRPDEVSLLDYVEAAPVIFQEFVPADVDLRVTVVGREIFVAAIHSRRVRYTVDYRLELESVPIEPAILPASVRNAVMRLMRRLGLRFGAIDLRRTPGGEYVFFEINPAGEWRFVEDRTNQPITDAVARHLASLDRPRVGRHRQREPTPDGGRSRRDSSARVSGPGSSAW